MKQNLVGRILGKIKIFVQNFVTIKTGITVPAVAIVFKSNQRQCPDFNRTGYTVLIFLQKIWLKFFCLYIIQVQVQTVQSVR